MPVIHFDYITDADADAFARDFPDACRFLLHASLRGEAAFVCGKGAQRTAWEDARYAELIRLFPDHA